MVVFQIEENGQQIYFVAMEEFRDSISSSDTNIDRCTFTRLILWHFDYGTNEH